MGGYNFNIAQLIIFLQFITAIVITVNYRKFQGNQLLSLFPVMFWITVLIEPFARYYGLHISETGNNQAIYNAFHIIRFTYFFALIYSIVKRKSFKTGVLFFAFLFALSMLVEVFYFKVNYFIQAQVIAYVIASLGICLSILLYFLELMDSATYSRIEQQPMFWISTAYFIYFLVFMLIKLIRNDVLEEDNFQYLLNLRFAPTILLNCLLIIGSIWSSRQLKP